MTGLLCTPLLLLATLAGVLALSSEEELPVTGGVQDADPEDEQVKHALDFAISEYNKNSDDKYYSRMLKLVGAQEQLVAGMYYIFDVELGQTTCTKDQDNLDDCPFQEESQLQKKICLFCVYDIPWLNTMTLSTSQCHKA